MSLYAQFPILIFLGTTNNEEGSDSSIHVLGRGHLQNW